MRERSESTAAPAARIEVGGQGECVSAVRALRGGRRGSAGGGW